MQACTPVHALLPLSYGCRVCPRRARASEVSFPLCDPDHVHCASSGVQPFLISVSIMLGASSAFMSPFGYQVRQVEGSIGLQPCVARKVEMCWRCPLFDGGWQRELSQQFLVALLS